MKSQYWRKSKKMSHGARVYMGVLTVLFAAAVLLMSGCGDPGMSTGNTAQNPSNAAASSPKVGQLDFNASENREYIFNGTEWVPHDASIDTYVIPQQANKVVFGSTTNLCYDADGNNLCPDLMHLKHGAVMNNCQGCHDLNYSFYIPDSFFKNPLTDAFIQATPINPNPLAPVYVQSSNWDVPPPATFRFATCSNIACHFIPNGTFEYYFPGGDGEPLLLSVNYGGVSSAIANWDPSSSAMCSSCHGNPPQTGVWHSGYHGGNTSIATNGCQLCHPDATTDSNGNRIVGGANPLHGNKTVNIQAKFKSSCFGCH